MSEEEKKKETQDEVHTIQLKRHLYPEEVELKKTKKKLKRVRILCVVLCLAGLGIGWTGGSLLPVGGLNALKDDIRSMLGFSTSNKIAEVKDVMENSWYFGKDIDDLEDRLVDQALIGMTTNSEDKHTAYMTKEETESFKQDINRNYVGIGAQFIMYNGYPIVTKIFPHSPSEQAGLQAGDIIEKVDGDSIEGMSSSDIKEKIQGEEGTQVTLGIRRNNQEMELTATRSEFSATTYAKMLDDSCVYLQLAQFGNSTAEDVENDLNDLIGNKENVTMILDLRNNGGGYLTSVKAVAAYFLQEKDVVMYQEFKDGSKVEIDAGPSDRFSQIKKIAILVNENTASAAEVMTLALKQNRDDVTVIGTTTYGKGTVQTTTSFKDGSALKYTTSRWLSPNQDWINDKGITPDMEIELDPAVTMTYPDMDENTTYEVDSVSDVVAAVQKILQYFGYEVDRTDGYFSQSTEEAWNQFNADHHLATNAVITRDGYMNAVSEVMYDWATSTSKDTQLAKAEEVVHG